MRLVQFRDPSGARGVAAIDSGKGDKAGEPRRLDGVESVYELALAAIEEGRSLAELAREARSKIVVDLDAAEAEGRLLPPLEHPVPTRCWVTGTGLTHVGGAEARDKMHRTLAADESTLTDSMKMWRWGVEGGKPAGGGPGVQPEWFYKGNGAALLGAGHPLPFPDFASDAGEEPELVGLYVIADDGTPCRVGFALGNELTDHVMEKQN